MSLFKGCYDGLGKNKDERFKRFMIIIIVISVVIMFGFYTRSITVNIKEVKVEQPK